MTKLAHLVLLFHLILFSNSCNNKSDITSQKNKDQALKIILTDPVETLDPMKIIYRSDWEVASNIYEGLVSLDENFELVYELIDTVIISEDKKDYTFFLKDNIFFHDNACFNDGLGRKLEAEDVYFTFERLANPNNNFLNWEIISDKIIGLNEYRIGAVDSIRGITLHSPNKFAISLTKPFEPFLKILTTPNFYIVPKESFKKYADDISPNAVGTGPFRLAEYTHHENIILVKHNKYYKTDKSNKQLPHLNSISFRTINDNEDRFRELIKGNTHLINANFNEYNLFKGDSLLRLQFTEKIISKGLGVRFWAFYFNEDGDNKEYKSIRKKITENFDRSFLINKAPKVNLAESLVPNYLIGEPFELPNYNSDIKNHQLAKDYSISLMANLEYLDLVELKKTISSLGLKCKEIIKPVAYYSEISNVKPTLFRVSMIPAFPDPIEYYALFYSKNSGSVNLGNFSNSQYDRYFELLQVEHDSKIKIYYYNELEKILRDEAAAIFLTHSGSETYLYSSKLKQIKYKFLIPDYRTAYFE